LLLFGIATIVAVLSLKDAGVPRAILFDLDDTILVAFGPAQSQRNSPTRSVIGCQSMSPSFIGSSGKHNGDALLYQTDEHRGVGGRRIGS
jgi:hypothetical protein